MLLPCHDGKWRDCISMGVRLNPLRKPRKLRHALAWLLIGALGPLLLASTFFLWWQWELQREASINRLSDVSLALQLSVDRELALDQTALQVLARSSAIDARDWPAFHLAAAEAAKLRPGTWVLLGDRSELLWLGLLLGMLGAATALAHRFWRRVALPLTELARQARQIGEHDIEMAPTEIEEVEILCKALKEAAHAERARRDEVARRLALEQDGRRLASRRADELRMADQRKDEFLAMLGHELRNPLAPIMNALAVMRRLGPADATLQRLQDMMERQTRQLARMVEDLLDVARINTGKIVLRRQRLDLRQVVEHAAQAAQAAMDRRGHVFSVVLPQEALWVDGDEARLAQILGNLLDNAAKYTEPGGTVSLSVEREQHSALVRVADNGRGIPPELLPRVFDLFAQGDAGGVRASGLGIGLHIVKRLVEKHRGQVSVQSVPGQGGTVFEVRLPLADTLASAHAHAATATPVRALHLLVVDDNEDAAESLAVLLRLDGHEVRVAHDGMQAIEAALLEPPDAVLLDINMPGLNGYEVARRLRAEPTLQDVVLIAVTGYSQPAQQRDIEQAGMHHHLTKPVDHEQVREVLARAVELRTRIG